jgi:hypothetical protein
LNAPSRQIPQGFAIVAERMPNNTFKEDQFDMKAILTCSNGIYANGARGRSNVVPIVESQLAYTETDQ